MTINPLSSASGTLSSLSGVSPTVGAVAAAGARSLALGVASEVGGYLLAPLSGPVVTGRGAPPLTSSPLTSSPAAYGIEALAEAIGQATGASPLDVVGLERALGELAAAVAVDVAALADGRTLDRLDAAQSAIGPDEGPATPTHVSDRIHTLANLLAEAR